MPTRTAPILIALLIMGILLTAPGPAQTPAAAQDWSRLSAIVPGDFVTMPTYISDPVLAFRAAGHFMLYLDLYRSTPEEMAAATFIRYRSPAPDIYVQLDHDYFGFDAIPWVKPANLLRHWEIPVAYNHDDETTFSVPLALEDGATPPLGLYGVEYRYGDSPDTDRLPRGYALVVANAGITIKRGTENSLIWVTDLATARPIAGATVTIYRHAEEWITGQTNADGVFLLDERLPADDYLFMTADAPGVFGAWFSSSPRVLSGRRSAIYTDREAYLPGETVYFRGVLRDRQDVTYTVPDLATIHVEAGDPAWYGQYSDDDLYVFYEADLPVTVFGTFSGSFVLPDDVFPFSSPNYAHSYEIRAAFDNGETNFYCHMGYSYCKNRAAPPLSIEFAVAMETTLDPIQPFTVTLEPERPTALHGDAFDIQLTARYPDGEPVKIKSTDWNFHFDAHPFTYAANPDYRFGIFCGPHEQSRWLLHPTTVGEVVYHYRDDPDPNRYGCGPRLLNIEVGVTSDTGTIMQGHTTLEIRPATTYIGIRPRDTMVEHPAPFEIDLITVTPEQTLLPNQPITVTVYEGWWEDIYNWVSFTTRQRIEVASDTLTTGPDGRATYTFHPPARKHYFLVFHTTDADGHPTSAILNMWSYGPTSETFVWLAGRCYFDDPNGHREYRCMTPVADPLSYIPGDTAQVLFPNPYLDSATVLLTQERAGVLAYDVREVSGSGFVYEFPVTHEHAPGVYASAVYLRGPIAEDANADFMVGDLHLPVDPIARRLAIDITTTPENPAPGDTLTFDITVTDFEGQPVEAELGLTLTDQFVGTPYGDSLEETFYGSRYLYVKAGVSLDSLIHGGSVQNRADYDVWPDYPRALPVPGGIDHVPLWEPHLVTDANGHAQITVTLPEHAATWTLDARAITRDTRVGETQFSFDAAPPLAGD